MDDTLSDLLDGDEDDILAKVQAESLRFYKEVELPRLQIVNQVAKETDTEENQKDLSSTEQNDSVQPSCSSVKRNDGGTILYEGEEARGFHLAAGSTYIYPTNYPIRQYQASITWKALFNNTLVCLPTGLGKTFIAAVVMYNYYRWYPKGKVIFMAPTRPLVAQQIKACHHIMNIPVSDTTEMTGMNNSDQRRTLWKDKRVFYLTPQVMVNDIKSGFCPTDLVKCIVFDEAHRAVKDYAYCQVVKLLAAAGGQYRTLALSATPGSDISAVQQVIRNLNITVLEIRGEESMDVTPYTHSKSVENVVVDLSPNILRVREDFLQIYDKYARRLKDYKAFSSNISFLSKFQVLKACERFRNNPPRGISPTVLGSLICDFTVCISLAHSLELLQSYGLRAFHSYLKNEGGEKCKAAISRLRNDEDMQRMLSHLSEILYPKPGSHIPYTWGHPKLQKLVATITEHFKTSNEKNEPTKAIVFCQYRVVVNEIVDILKKCPLIKPEIFIGQSGGKEKGMPQVKQIQIMKDFREGRLNCLVATCVAEEGLDIGEVDLILLMETQKSPVRLVQRLGRTGRKRKGRCVVFLTRGKELEKFHTAMAARKSYVNNIVNSDVIKSSLRQYSPAMIPSHISPQQQLVHIIATELVSPARAIKNKQVDIRSCFGPQTSPFLTAEQLNEIKTSDGSLELNLNRIPERMEIWHRAYDGKISIVDLLDKNVKLLSYWNDWNVEKQPTYFVDHTDETEMLCHLLRLSENTDELNQIYQDYEKYEAVITKSESPEKKIQENKEAEKSGTTIEKDVEQESENSLKGKRGKKSKKENVKTTGKILDIRTCMAAAASKTKQTEIIEIVDLIDECESPVQYVPSSPDLKTKENDSLDFLEGLLILFQIETKEREKFKKETDLFCCSIEKDVETYSRLQKYMVPKHFHLNYSSAVPDVDIPNVDDIISNLDTLLKINTSPKAIESCKIDTKSMQDVTMDRSMNLQVFSETEKINSEKKDVSLFDSDEFVNLDDLFINGNDSNDLIPKDMEGEWGNSETEQCGERSLENLKIQHTKEKCLNPMKNEQLTSNNISDKKVVTPHKDVNVKGPMWEDTPDVLKTLNIFDLHSSKLVSSTPLQPKSGINKSNFRLDCSAEEKLSPEKISEPVVEDGVWNLSDLFDSGAEENDELIGTGVTDSTMVGITQLVSQIEKVKKNNMECKVVNIMNEENSELKSQKTHIASTSEGLLKTIDLTETDKDENFEILFKDEHFINKVDGKSESQIFKEAIEKESEKIDDKVLTIDSLDINIKSPSLKPNFRRFSQTIVKDNSTLSNVVVPKENNGSFNDSVASEFAFTCHKTQNQATSKPNFKSFKRKQIFNSFPLAESCLTQGTIQTIDSNNKCDSAEQNSIINKKDSFKCNSTNNLDLKTGNITKNLEISPCVKFNTIRKKTSDRVEHVSLPDDSDEDDVFEKANLKYNKKAGDSSFESSSPSPIKKPKKRLKECAKNGFIENEAEVSGILSLDDSDNSSLDHLDESFINDDSHNHTGNDTHAEYLRSIKSPKGGGGKFKIPVGRICLNMDVFSQQVEQEMDYINDSFCVSSSGEELETTNDEDCQLELAERMLSLEKKDRKNKKRKVTEKSLNKKSKRRRIISPESEKSPITSLEKSIIVIKDDADGAGTNSKGFPRKKVIFSDSDCDSPIKKCQRKLPYTSPS